MKNRVLNTFLLFAMVGVMFTACKKEYPEPPIEELPIGTVYTIEEILAMEDGTVFNEDASVYGIITADEQSGNLYKAAFMQDRKSGAAIELYLNAVSGVRIGDSVRVYLKDVTYAMYNGLPQLKDFEADGHIVILANLPKEKQIKPALTTIDEIKTGKYLAGLVRLENVRFTDQNVFADPATSGDRTLVDASDYSKKVIVRTSNYANFANDSLPQGPGNLVAIASYYEPKDVWQMIIRSVKELEFEGYVPGGDADLPYYQDFTSSFGSYTTYDVLGAESFEIAYSTAKMTGYVNNSNRANEDWLISKRFSMEGVSQASLTMSYIMRYFNNVNEDVTIQVSTDYTSGDPTAATWSQVPASWTEGSDWNTFASTTVDLSQFAGQKVTVAVKYLSNDEKAGTLEVQSILIQEGSGPTPPPGPQPGGELQAMPYTQSFTDEFGTYTTYDVSGPQSWIIDYHTAKMTGYSGGSHANEDWLISSPVAVTGVENAKVSVTYSAQYQNADETDVTLMVSTDYVYGNNPTAATWTRMSSTYPNTSSFNDFQTVETSLNDFIGQNVYVAIKYTSTDAQSRTIEVQSITVQEGAAGGGVGPTPPGPQPGGELQAMPYTQSFTNEFGTYMTYDVSGPQSWIIDYHTAKMTGYSGSSHANEDWLISSPVAVTGVNNAKVSVTYSAQYQNADATDVTMQVSTDYVFGNAPTSATWTQMSATYPNTSSFNDFQTVETSLNDFIGQNVYVAIKYTSTDAQSRTIEVQSITVQEGEAGGGPTPPPTPGQGEGSGTQDDPYNVVAGIENECWDCNNQTATNAPIAWVHGYIVGAVKNGVTSVSSNSDILWNGTFDSQTNVVIADDPSCNEISQCIIVNLPSGKPLRTQVNLADHPENLGKTLAVYGRLRTYFGQAGLRDSGGTEADFVLEGGVTPTPPEPGTGIFSETFANGQGQFTIHNVVLPSELTYVWTHDGSRKHMKASAFKSNTPYKAESWLVSPQIDLAEVRSATLTFEQAINYAEPQDRIHVMVSTNFTGAVGDAVWTELVFDQWPVNDNQWVFVTSTIDLSSYAGQQVTIAFKYTSEATQEQCPTWEVKNVVVE